MTKGFEHKGLVFEGCKQSHVYDFKDPDPQ